MVCTIELPAGQGSKSDIPIHVGAFLQIILRQASGLLVQRGPRKLITCKRSQLFRVGGETYPQTSGSVLSMSFSMPGSLDIIARPSVAAVNRSHPLNKGNRHTEPEDMQTTHDVHLFNDETDSMSDEPTATNAMNVNKREIENVQESQVVCLIVQMEVGDKLIGLIQPIAKWRYQEVDHSHTLCQTVYVQEGQANLHEEAQMELQEQWSITEADHVHHKNEIDSMTCRWETSLTE
ncbi:hypothetical protein BDR05DRAFT_948403 [Suillus weaverae]|nr:hypothetical protein BDR05DRAFT_948403 [Suillus weaverae]